ERPSPGDRSWNVPSALPRACLRRVEGILMPMHTVQQGETISTIARQFKVPVPAVWDAPENAELRERRTDPSVLFEGDQVFVPDDIPPKEAAARTGRIHYFRYVPKKMPFHARFEDSGAPRGWLRVLCSVDGGAEEEATLDSEGMLTVEIPIDASEVVVRIHPDTDHEEQVTFTLRHLDPHVETRGLQQRLNNLAFEPGAEDHEFGERTEAAISLYQASEGLERNGQLDEPTMRALHRRHGV
ncbi:MAG: peptidoglycan-binding protein, partial [Myxococcota bacterium]